MLSPTFQLKIHDQTFFHSKEQNLMKNSYSRDDRNNKLTRQSDLASDAINFTGLLIKSIYLKIIYRYGSLQNHSSIH